MSAQPVLFELSATCTEALPAPASVDTLRQIPRSVLLAAQRLHDFQGLVRATHLKLSWRRNPVAGLRYASERAEASDQLLKVPDFVRAPSELQQRWLQNGVSGAVVVAAGRFLFVNSPLNGSDNLRKWILGGYMATLRAFRCASPTCLGMSLSHDALDALRAQHSECRRLPTACGDGQTCALLDALAMCVVHYAKAGHASQQFAAGKTGTCPCTKLPL